MESYINCGATAEVHLKTNFGNTCFPLALQACDYGNVYAALQLHIVFDISSVMIVVKLPKFQSCLMCDLYGLGMARFENVMI